MSKTPVNFEAIDGKALACLNGFVVARIAIAKEDMRHMAEMKPLKAKLEAIHENREIDLKNGMSLDDVIRKHSSVEVDKAIRAENNLHKETLKPLNEDLKSTYVFMPDGIYNAYVRKIELGKRGDFISKSSGILEIDVLKMYSLIFDYCKKSKKNPKEVDCILNNEVLVIDGKNIERVAPLVKPFMVDSPKADYYENRILERAEMYTD